ncbi:hypothetical protein PGTUg99_001795 [Puccinia graminis f. sp. tritici]|uniref:Uncharacterized protein n=1 Tax=Puccinia graminis f. sp. tritici TaxID=56615 RepID=A0A5B0N303_PUCGR|nr:hypothetical protein PGTUg99_001795 [Puccinia graminis f. sp. tritici]
MSQFNLCASYSDENKAEFIVDAVLFDMDGTLIDFYSSHRIPLGLPLPKRLTEIPKKSSDETHGRRVMDNLRDLKTGFASNVRRSNGAHVKGIRARSPSPSR